MGLRRRRDFGKLALLCSLGAVTGLMAPGMGRNRQAAVRQRPLYSIGEAEVSGAEGREAREAYDIEVMGEESQQPLAERRTRRLNPTKLPLLAVVGRPNTGKSTIVNRLCATHLKGAIVYNEPGVTRDRIYQDGYFNEHRFKVVDTGGLVFEEEPDHLFSEQIKEQAMIAIDEATAVLLVVDGRVGPTAMDEAIARFLRSLGSAGPPCFVAVNKCDSGVDPAASEFWKLGLGEPVPVSGIHGSGIAEMLEQVVEVFPPPVPEGDEMGEEMQAYRVALVGRPNVGKSSLLNRLAGKQRSIVSEIAGTTRDSIDADMEHEGELFTFVDTAGIRKRTKVEHGSEYLMVNRAFKAVRRSDVVLLLVDATDGIRDQDRVLSQRIAEEGRACVVVINKWDAVEKNDGTHPKALKYVQDNLPAVGRWAKPVFISALTGQRVSTVFAAIKAAAEQHQRRVPTATLNEVVRDAVMWQPPPKTNSKQGRIYYANQIGVGPPTIVLFVNDPKAFGDGYKRYLDRKVRAGLGFEGTPIRWIWRGKKLRQVKKDFVSRKPHAN